MGRQSEELVLTHDPRHAWSSTVWAWASWLRRSPKGLVLADWLGNPPKYQAVLGEDGLRTYMLELRRDARYEDCAAAGFSFEPGDTRHGHLGGWIEIDWSPDGRHRAVFWSESDWPGARLWVDGEAVTLPDYGEYPFHAPGGGGRWTNERFLAARVAGPDHPPMQDPFAPAPRILSLLLYDVRLRRTHLLHPGADEAWLNPVVEAHGDSLHVWANFTLEGYGHT